MDNCTDQTFSLQGLTKGYYQNETCEVDTYARPIPKIFFKAVHSTDIFFGNSYGTQFTITKAANGTVELTPRSGSLVFLNLIGQNLSSMSCESF